MAEQPISRTETDPESELDDIVEDHLGVAIDYLSALQSGQPVEDDKEIFCGQDTFDDSYIMEKLRERLLSCLDLSVAKNDVFFDNSAGRRRKLYEIFRGQEVDLVCMYDLHEVDLDGREDAMGYNLRLTTPGMYKKGKIKS